MKLMIYLLAFHMYITLLKAKSSSALQAETHIYYIYISTTHQFFIEQHHLVYLYIYMCVMKRRSSVLEEVVEILI